MKNIIILFTILLAFSCEDKNEKNQELTPLEQLPPKTQVGANTAGCLVDGKAVYPKGTFTRTFNLFYQNQKDLGISFTFEASELKKSINIASLNEELEVGKIYTLRTVENNSKYGQYFERFPNLSRIDYETNNEITGELRITHHNYNQATISGTFWFDAVDKDGNKVEIREGRFDGEY
tara:strand:+ start:490 stop:1023 length:534 start_codon:yes stop_codon:yes gene_type:complete